MIKTDRLILSPETPYIWTIKDHHQNTLGQLGHLHGMFSVELIHIAKNLGVATEAATAWLAKQQAKDIQAIVPESPQNMAFLQRLHFKKTGNNMQWQGQIPQRQYLELNKNLGIDTKQLTAPYCLSACQLIACGPDVFNRPAKLTPDATHAWQNMQQKANDDDILLQLVSAYRSPKYQAGLIQNKLNKGQAISDILCVNTAPGHSEHHTGRAIDVTTPDFDVLEEHFEASPAFEWLCQNAATYNFHLSYPKNNQDGIIYEPWHWCFNGD